MRSALHELTRLVVSCCSVEREGDRIFLRTFGLVGGWGGSKQLDHVAIDVTNKNLGGAVRSTNRAPHFKAKRLEVGDPGREVIGLQREVVAAVVRDHRLLTTADNVELLLCSETKPRARKIEGRPRQGFKLQDF